MSNELSSPLAGAHSASTSDSPRLLVISDVRGGYGRINVLEGIALSVGSGEVVGVLGHNGMGKTTLMRAIMGEVKVTGGDVKWQGRSIRSMPTHARAALGLGYVPQGRRIFPQLTVRENLQFAAACRKGVHVDHVVDEVLEEFTALIRLLDRPGGALSGGEQQLLALARCLCTAPQLVLLDEPTEGIQPSIIDDMVGLLKGWRERRGLSIVLVEQHVDFLHALCDRILLLHKGRVVSVADASDTMGMDALISAAGFVD